MSNIQVNNGDNVSIGGITSTQQTLKVNQPSVNVAVTGVIASTSGDKNYVHDQASPSASWTITHNLNKNPSVSVVDSAATQILCEVEYDSDNQVTLFFDAATSGKAYLN